MKKWDADRDSNRTFEGGGTFADTRLASRRDVVRMRRQMRNKNYLRAKQRRVENEKAKDSLYAEATMPESKPYFDAPPEPEEESDE